MNNIYIKVEYILEVILAYNNAGLEHEMLKYHGHQYPSVQHYNLLEKVASQVIALLEIQHYNLLEKVASQVIALLEIQHYNILEKVASQVIALLEIQHYNLLEKVASQVIALLEIQHYNILEKVASQVIALLEILHSHSVVSMHLGVLEEVGPHLRLPYLQLYVFGRQP